MNRAAEEWTAQVAAWNAVETVKALALRKGAGEQTDNMKNRGDLCHED